MNNKVQVSTKDIDNWFDEILGEKNLSKKGELKVTAGYLHGGYTLFKEEEYKFFLLTLKISVEELHYIKDEIKQIITKFIEDCFLIKEIHNIALLIVQKEDKYKLYLESSSLGYTKSYIEKRENIYVQTK